MSFRHTAAGILLGISVVIGTVFAGNDHGKASIGKTAPDFSLTDSGGKDHKLSDYRGKYVVLEWINFDCPFVRKHYGSGNMQKLQTSWAEKEVVWLTICSSAEGKQGYYTGNDLKEHMKSSKIASAAYLLDTSGTVGRMYEARTTPHMFVIDPEGKLIYAGAIDNKPSTKTADIEGATNYVQACLTSAVAGKAVTTTASTPYGCSIKYAE